MTEAQTAGVRNTVAVLAREFLHLAIVAANKVNCCNIPITLKMPGTGILSVTA